MRLTIRIKSGFFSNQNVTNALFSFKKFMIYIFALNCKNKYKSIKWIVPVRACMHACVCPSNKNKKKNDEEKMFVMPTTYE